MLHIVLGLVLFLPSLLAVLEPPNPAGWLVSVGAKELGWVWALLCLPLLWPGWIHSAADSSGALIALVALVLYLTPLVRGAAGARQALEAFADVPAAPGDRSAPFRWRDVFLGVRAKRVPVQTYTYAVHDGQELKLDLYRPVQQATPAPVVLVIHGGAWRGGDRNQLPALNHYLAGRGYAVAALSYRLAPLWQFPHMKEDVNAALRFLKEHAAELGVDATRIALLGRSAGAQLAVVTACTAGDPAIRGAISYYGPLDVEWGYPQPCKVLDSKTVLKDFLGGTPEQVPTQYRDATVKHLLRDDTPPLLMIQGAADTMVAPTHSYHTMERLKELGRPYRYLEIPMATHASDVLLSTPFGQIATFAVERFLRSIM